MISFINKVKKAFLLNKDEKFFINQSFDISPSNSRNKYKSNAIFNATEEYKPPCFLITMLKDKSISEKLYLYLSLVNWSKKNFSKNPIIYIFSFFLSSIVVYFRNRKWKKIYSKTKIKHFITLNNYNIFKEIKNLNKSKKIINKINSKKELQKLRIKNILIGDLVYDTYLRYSQKVTVDLNDFFLVEILAKVFNHIEKLEKIDSELNLRNFYTNQLAYVHNGVVSRFFKHKNKKVFNLMWTNGAYISPLSTYFYSYNFKQYRKLFSKEKSKFIKINESKKLLKHKFNGKIIPQENFMPISAYNKMSFNLKKFKCVIFLHCFVDSPTSRGKCLFTDFSEWIEQTLSFLSENKLDSITAIKPHPDSKKESLDYVKVLKKKYPKFMWLEKNVSNLTIFRLKPNIGISVMGTVLHELAYHNILPVAAGESSTDKYNFVYRPKNIKNYFKFIKKNIIEKKVYFKPNKNEILEWVYMTYLYDKSPYKLLAKKMNLKNLNFYQSNVLKKFSKRFKDISS